MKRWEVRSRSGSRQFLTRWGADDYARWCTMHEVTTIPEDRRIRYEPRRISERVSVVQLVGAVALAAWTVFGLTVVLAANSWPLIGVWLMLGLVAAAAWFMRPADKT